METILRNSACAYMYYNPPPPPPPPPHEFKNQRAWPMWSQNIITANSVDTVQAHNLIISSQFPTKMSSDQIMVGFPNSLYIR